MTAVMNPSIALRDPMLAAALDAHGHQWRPDLTPLTQLPRDDRRKLPGVELRTLEHRIEWPNGDGRAVHKQKWVQNDGRGGQSGWRASFHMAPLPETLGLALIGRTLDHVIGAPGAEAWVVTDVLTVPGVQSMLTLGRARTQALAA